MKTPEQWKEEESSREFVRPFVEVVAAIQSDARADETARADKAEAACKELQTLLSFAEPTRMPAHLALDWHERRNRALAAVKE